MHSPPDFKTLMLLLSTALGYSFIVERILEGLNGFLDKWLRISPRPPSRQAPSVEEQLAALSQRLEQDRKERLAEERAEILAQLNNPAKKISPAKARRLRSRLKKLDSPDLDPRFLDLPEAYSPEPVLTEPVTPRDPDKTARSFWLQLIGTFAGIAVCFYARFGLLGPIGLFRGLPDALDWLFTGILIGSGSQPIHFLIQFVTQRKVVELKVAPGEESAPESQPAPAAPQIYIPAEPLDSPLSIPYDGGVDRDKLEAVHLRPGNPNLIVYHHTAMHSDSTFADVVAVIRSRGWLTGYHCVVTADGAVHAFCRWDRYGNHARGYNFRSLGIAFNGNFENNPAVPYSNADGHLGRLQPTDEQLRAGAAVIALWTFLYKIPLNFNENILPHHRLSDKTCPGSQFPEDRLKALVRNIHARWRKSERAMQEIAVFRQKQFIYA